MVHVLHALHQVVDVGFVGGNARDVDMDVRGKARVDADLVIGVDLAPDLSSGHSPQPPRLGVVQPPLLVSLRIRHRQRLAVLWHVLRNELGLVLVLPALYPLSAPPIAGHFGIFAHLSAAHHAHIEVVKPHHLRGRPPHIDSRRVQQGHVIEHTPQELFFGGVAHPLVEPILSGLDFVARLIDELQALASHEKRHGGGAPLKGRAVVGKRPHPLREQVVVAEVHPFAQLMHLLVHQGRNAPLLKEVDHTGLERPDAALVRYPLSAAHWRHLRIGPGKDDRSGRPSTRPSACIISERRRSRTLYGPYAPRMHSAGPTPSRFASRHR